MKLKTIGAVVLAFLPSLTSSIELQSLSFYMLAAMRSRTFQGKKNRIVTPNQHSSVYFFENQEGSWASTELRAKPAINRQTTKELLLIKYIGQLDSANTASHCFR